MKKKFRWTFESVQKHDKVHLSQDFFDNLSRKKFVQLSTTTANYLAGTHSWSSFEVKKRLKS